jgi:hypothetical protein
MREIRSYIRDKENIPLQQMYPDADPLLVSLPLDSSQC